MYFNKLSFGGALAVLEGINSSRISLSDEYFSQPVQSNLNKLQTRTQDIVSHFDRTLLLDLNKSTDTSREKLLEDCFIYLFINNKDNSYCDSFYKTITSSFKVFEKFCFIYKDYLNTKSKLETIQV